MHLASTLHTDNTKPHVPQVTLLGLWLFPAVIAFHLTFWRFCAIWAAYTGVTAYFLSLCVNRRVLDRSTPKRVRVS